MPHDHLWFLNAPHGSMPSTHRKWHSAMPSTHRKRHAAMPSTHRKWHAAMPSTQRKGHAAMPSTHRKLHAVIPSAHRKRHARISIMRWPPFGPPSASEFLERPHIVALNKFDLVRERGSAEFDKERRRLTSGLLSSAAGAASETPPPLAIVPMSGLRGRGLRILREAISTALRSATQVVVNASAPAETSTVPPRSGDARQP